MGIAGLALLLGACAGEKTREQPVWVKQAVQDTAGDPLVLSQKLTGRWQVDEAASDNVREVMQERFDRRWRKRMENIERNDPSMRGARRPGAPELTGFGGFKGDPRLSALSASGLEIIWADRKLVFRYDMPQRPDNQPDSTRGPSPANLKRADGQMNAAERAYPVNGDPVSSDGNVNIAFAEWVNGQFIIEHNGPHGRIVETWTPSPDAGRLHLQIQLNNGFFPEPIVISRLFNRVEDIKKAAPLNGMPPVSSLD